MKVKPPPQKQLTNETYRQTTNWDVGSRNIPRIERVLTNQQVKHQDPNRYMDKEHSQCIQEKNTMVNKY